LTVKTREENVGKARNEMEAVIEWHGTKISPAEDGLTILRGTVTLGSESEQIEIKVFCNRPK
jgi:hypothetical protein